MTLKCCNITTTVKNAAWRAKNKKKTTINSNLFKLLIVVEVVFAQTLIIDNKCNVLKKQKLKKIRSTHTPHTSHHN